MGSLNDAFLRDHARHHEVHHVKPVALLSRSGFILINNLFLVASACIVLIAILYPLALELMHAPGISVGPSYFNSTFLPMTAPLPILAALAPLMAWDITPAPQLRRLITTLLPALLIGALISLALIAPLSALATLSLALTGWLLYGTYLYLQRLRRAQVRLFSDLGLRHVASASAHAGLALFILGMGLTATCKQTYEAPLTSAPMTMGRYTVRLLKGERVEQNNFITRRATLQVMHDGKEITTLTPELRYYPVRAMQTTQAALYSTPWRDIYIVMGEADYAATHEQAALGIRLYITPGQQLIWYGFLLAGFGGLIALLTALRRKDR